MRAVRLEKIRSINCLLHDKKGNIPTVTDNFPKYYFLRNLSKAILARFPVDFQVFAK